MLHNMREAYATIGKPGDDAHSVLIEWGGQIKIQFDADNLHLTGRRMHDGHSQIIHSLQGLASNVSGVHLQVSDMVQHTIDIDTYINRYIYHLSTPHHTHTLILHPLGSGCRMAAGGTGDTHLK